MSLSVMTRAFLALLIVSGATLAQQHDHAEDAGPSNTASALSSELQQLLSQEMIAIEKGMQELVPAIASGNWPEITAIGTQIEASYILAQKLTDAQQRELHDALPPGFLDLDLAFHENAGRLAHAGESKNAEVVNFYFFKLNEGCVTCHSRFASQRFPRLSADREIDRH